MSNINQESTLLNKAINLRKRYKLVDTLSAKPFNIFTILRAERNERYTHSAFIAELLNPNGSHCQGTIFLQLFLYELEWPEIKSEDLINAVIKVEHHIGNGFIDIWIDLKNVCICIENKIDALDQKDQLSRYNKYCLNYGKPYKIIYLTLDGHESSDSIKNPIETIEYLTWSYKIKIVAWLDASIKECARIPVLRETIYQYQQLLKKLCGSLQNENEAMELNKLLKSTREEFEAANNIHEQFKTVKYQVKYDIWEEIASQLNKKYEENYTVEFHFAENETYPKIVIGHKSCEYWYACFCIERLQGETYYGIISYAYGGVNAEQKKIIKSYEDLNINGFRKSDWWFSWKYYDNIDFNTIETLLKFFSQTEKQNLINQIIDPIIKLITDYGDRILIINNEIYDTISKSSTV